MRCPDVGGGERVCHRGDFASPYCGSDGVLVGNRCRHGLASGREGKREVTGGGRRLGVARELRVDVRGLFPRAPFCRRMRGYRASHVGPASKNLASSTGEVQFHVGGDATSISVLQGRQASLPPQTANYCSMVSLLQLFPADPHRVGVCYPFDDELDVGNGLTRTANFHALLCTSI